MADAGDLLARFRSLSTRLRHARSDHDAEVAVVAGTIAAETVGMAALGLMLHAKQNVQIRITTLNWIHALSYLRDREAELAIVEISECGDEPDLIVEPLHRHPGGFAVRPGHPLAGKSGLTLAGILRYPLCFLGRLPDRVIPQFVTAREAAQCGGGAYPVFPAGIVESPTAALLATRNSDAVVPVTGSLARAWLRSGEIVLLPWHEPWLATGFGIVHLRVRPPSAATTAFIECIRQADDNARRDDEMLLAAIAAASSARRSA
jgi:DNA-binding transcriptional LysR family regulator